MNYSTLGAAILLITFTAGCASDPSDRRGMGGDAVVGKRLAGVTPPMDPHRRIIELNCTDSHITDGGNLRCMQEMAWTSADRIRATRASPSRKTFHP